MQENLSDTLLITKWKTGLKGTFQMMKMTMMLTVIRDTEEQPFLLYYNLKQFINIISEGKHYSESK